MEAEGRSSEQLNGEDSTASAPASVDHDQQQRATKTLLAEGNYSLSSLYVVRAFCAYALSLTPLSLSLSLSLSLFHSFVFSRSVK